jgi:hypothetical protein
MGPSLRYFIFWATEPKLLSMPKENKNTHINEWIKKIETKGERNYRLNKNYALRVF